MRRYWRMRMIVQQRQEYVVVVVISDVHNDLHWSIATNKGGCDGVCSDLRIETFS